MKIIVGLGNPGKEYKDTRHNVGFMVMEELASRYRVEKQESRFDAIIGHIRMGGEKVLLVKPLTYMNLSGKSVQPLMHWYKLDLNDLMVVYDDMDLPMGTLRIRKQGGNGGHKGMASISDRLGSQDFARSRIGIGRPNSGEAVNWVLGRFTEDEREQIRMVVKNAADALEKWVQVGIDEAMNAYN
ncbi:Peptidyl-tRNA hydrolase [Syntrophomonas zehnderi OL-4]|uniref:Peptidyl-tRNA hydrolase n=1 Tax=Syntrophomonas zehnderi OL-4 TaxID=690567 RepID=A0A0E4C7S4_9FIRM|nr:aminoacyl-tRNA hydrolase [Syntrophomonas zehnderi]CFX10162.1 Peptidyl-tRNA hydrolase [Syntrophomonas zehnderi OL-4]